MSAEAEGRALAERFREEQHLGVQPLGDLVAVIEQTTGIDVAVLEAGQDQHGLMMRDPQRGSVFIGVARTRRPMRQRSSLAHELGHALFEDMTDASASTWDHRSPEEIRADAFARHLLIPFEGLREFLGGQGALAQSVLSEVVQHFLVSPSIAAIALCRAGYIDDGTKQSWRKLTTPQLATRFGWSDQYRALQDDSDRGRAPQRLLARAISAYAEGVLSVQAIATLRGISRREAEAELREAGVVPKERAVAWADPTDLPNAEIDLAALDAVLDAPEFAPGPSDTTPGEDG
ncbi:ImmA/IrrE family metallo-endopeptidase [Nocardiopsis sp. JB363]|uniref:ImmA/IrrE family metallo-endopeptidase n=1 Tax=Nocardiopsis sp. JB363 TaxID=1434837 RepID=UPI00097B6093|nr:ImmA/IrrE family metallo-endopeptidase [Nocardiopsis sp. JB363]SIO90009.1 Zn peptidase with DNA binding [Nocardiopsis sp. JB363]